MLFFPIKKPLDFSDTLIENTKYGLIKTKVFNISNIDGDIIVMKLYENNISANIIMLRLRNTFFWKLGI